MCGTGPSTAVQNRKILFMEQTEKICKNRRGVYPRPIDSPMVKSAAVVCHAHWKLRNGVPSSEQSNTYPMSVTKIQAVLIYFPKLRIGRI